MIMDSVLVRSAGRLVLIGLLCFLQGTCAQPLHSKVAKAKTLEPDAKSRASEAYKRSVGNEVKKYDCHLAEETDSEWVYVCKDLDEAPPPGADSMVLVKKATGSVEVIPGR